MKCWLLKIFPFFLQKQPPPTPHNSFRPVATGAGHRARVFAGQGELGGKARGLAAVKELGDPPFGVTLMVMNDD